MKKLDIMSMPLEGKHVLTRVDFNVPLDNSGNITDDIRIQAAIPTIEYIIENQGIPVLLSHLGRPNGKKVDSLRLLPVAKRLKELLKRNIIYLTDTVGDEIEKKVKDAQPGDVILLENVRFYPGEELNDDSFARKLAFLGDVYINDAFGCSHRAHASISGVTKYLKAGAGLLLKKEIEYINKLIDNPEKPFVAILGGAKVSDKIGVINNLMNLVDSIFIGGGMAYTFLAAKGMNIGSSKLEADKIEVARDLLASAKKNNTNIFLPVDHLIADKINEKARIRLAAKEIKEGWLGVDIGPKTIALYAGELRKAKTVVWNGPMGIFELPKFAEGTHSIANVLTQNSGIVVIGGGDSAAAVRQFNLSDKFSHISTGGGATLEMLEGKSLPGIDSLSNK